MAINLYKTIAVSSVKIAAFAIDFALVFAVVAYYSHSLIACKITSGNLMYLADIILGITAMLIYGTLLLLIHNRFSMVSNILNFIIAVIGVSVAYPLALDFISTVFKVLGIIQDTFTRLHILDSQIANNFIHYLIIFLLAIPVCKARTKYLNSSNNDNILVTEDI